MDMDHHHDMGGDMASPPMNGTTGMRNKMMMHMTFFWGSSAEILFHRWPGDDAGMYALALVVVFAMAVLVEWLSHSRFIKPGSRHFAAGLIQTLMHAIRMGLAYLIMLALMSFNGGVFLVAVAGHALGFFFFGSRAFRSQDYEKGSAHPPLSC